MHVAVLGGGLQGCCVAMALAEKGARVTLFDRNTELLTRAAVANEGKIHLGYMYAGDSTLNTARMMMQGALAFAPFLSKHLGVSYESFEISKPAVYVVHRRSQKSADEVQAYICAVHSLIQEAAANLNGAYFGVDLRKMIQSWSSSELDRELNPEEICGAFTSPEVAIDPVALARLIRSRIEQTPSIDLRLEHTVTSVEEDTDLEVVSSASHETQRERFDHVVNALWDGRLAIDSTMGLLPGRPWIHRLKYGVQFRPPVGAQVERSITIVLGPFGEVVSYGNGSVYLTWYPDCLRSRTREVQPPDWPTSPSEPLRAQILEGTFNALSAILPALRVCDFKGLTDVVVRGGPIVAWGETDIDDPGSELHRRFEIGVTSVGRYHTVDPGKLTMAPFFAHECATRIAG
jgi:glycine/D-amino acid oxidase-like deaminating enzyme